MRRRVHACASVAALAFLAVLFVALLSPGRYSLGPLVVRLDSIRNPLLELLAAVAVAIASSPRRPESRRLAPLRALRARWASWGTGGRIFACALAVKLLVTGVGLARVVDDYVSLHRRELRRFEEPIESVFRKKNRYQQFAYVFERARVELPADARVLYRGRGEGQLLSYVLYPRPVFMHPDDRYSGWIAHQTLDLGEPLPADPLFPSRLGEPEAGPPMEQFIREHALTHAVRFVESDLGRSTIEAIH